MDSSNEDQPKPTVGEAGAKGGKARAEKMSREERQEIGRRGATKRWHSDLPKATHEGVMEIGHAEIQCAVLDAGNKRVLTQSSSIARLGERGRPRGETTMMVTSTSRRS